MIERFTAQSVAKQLIVLISYCVLWLATWIFSINLETITAKVSWFLPAGVRVAYLLFLPKKYWVSIFIAEVVGAQVINAYIEKIEFESLYQMLMYTTVPALVYMLCISEYLKKYQAFQLHLVSHLIGLLKWVVISIVLFALLFHISRPTETAMDLFQLVEMSFAFALGDLIGIIAIVIPVSLVQLLYQKTLDSSKLLNASLASFAVMAIYLAVHVIDIDIAIHTRVLALLMFIYIGYHYKSVGAGCSVIAIISIFVLGILFDIELGPIIDSQLFVIATSLTTLLIGAAIGEQKLMTDALQRNNEELVALNARQAKLSKQLNHNNQALSVLNEQLMTTLNDNQELAKKLVNVQEVERTQIARELHDQIGQNITAIKVNLAVTKSSSHADDIIQLINEAESIADSMYDSTQELIKNLYPRELEEMGLKKALSKDVIGQVLINANIDYQAIITGDVDKLDDNYAVAIYRIAQEAINNTVKHSAASRLELLLEVTDQLIYFTITDNGKGFDPDAVTQGMGLVNIRDRVSAIGGSYNLSSRPNKTSHKIRFVLA